MNDGSFWQTHQTRSRVTKSIVRIGANSKGGRKGFEEAVTGDRPQIDARAELIQAHGRMRPWRAEEAALLKLLKSLFCRDYEGCVEPAAETFGLAASSLSRRVKRASAKKLAELTERDLSS